MKLRKKIFWTDRDEKIGRRHHVEQEHVERAREEQYKDIPTN